MKNKIITALFLALFSANLIFGSVMFLKIGDLEKSNENLKSAIGEKIFSLSDLDILLRGYSKEIEDFNGNLFDAYKTEINGLLTSEIDKLYDGVYKGVNEINALFALRNEDNKRLLSEIDKINDNIKKINKLFPSNNTKEYALLLDEIDKLKKMLGDINTGIAALSLSFENRGNIKENAVPLSVAVIPEEDNITETETEAETETEIKSGQAVILYVGANQVSDMYGYQFRLYFDKDEFEYAGGIASSISEISAIFVKEFDSYLLVGATKIGPNAGFSGENASVCEITLTAKKDLSAPKIFIGDVNLVKSDLTYTENITDWKIDRR